MSTTKNYILANARVVDPARGIDEIMDIGIDGGIITPPENVSNPETIDLTGLAIVPGLIDMHVHLRQPGQTAKENIHSGTMAAAAGGFTTVVAMPNTSPVADTPGSIEHVRRHTETEGVVKVLPCGAMTKGLEGKEMAGIGGLKKAGVVAISDDGNCIQNHELMRHVVEYAKTFELPILDHCEDDILLSKGVMHEGLWSVRLGFNGMASAAEELMVCRDVILSRLMDWKIHIQHVSAKDSLERVKHARERGIQVSAEVTPHHITLIDECVKSFDTNFKMNPPLRAEEDRQAMIQGLRDNTITVIASDHAPHTPTDKTVEFDYAPFGVIGLETSVPVCLTELYHKDVLSLSDLIAKFTTGPAEVLNLDSGTLIPGRAADITVLNLDLEYKIDPEKFLSKSRNTPFNGREVRGKAVATFVDGELIYSELPGMSGSIN